MLALLNFLIRLNVLNMLALLNFFIPFKVFIMVAFLYYIYISLTLQRQVYFVIWLKYFKIQQAYDH